MPARRVLPFERIAELHPAISIEAEVLARSGPPPGLPGDIGSIASDGSLRPSTTYPCGYEARMGPYAPGSLVNGVTRSFAVMNAWSNGISVNRSCGLHVHVDMSRVTADRRAITISRWLLYEPLFMACVPYGRSMNNYCTPLGGLCENFRANNWSSPLILSDRTRSELETEEFGRYLALNPASFGRHTTYEVRLASGTSMARRALEWAYLVSRALNRFAEQPTFDDAVAKQLYTHSQTNLDLMSQSFKEVLGDSDAYAIARTLVSRNNRRERYLRYPMLSSNSNSYTGQFCFRRQPIVIPRGFNLV